MKTFPPTPPGVVRRATQQAAVYVAPALSKKGSPWTDEDCHRIIQEGRPEDPILSRQLGRTVAAIRSKRAAILADSSLRNRVLTARIPAATNRAIVPAEMTMNRVAIEAGKLGVKLNYEVGDPSWLWSLLQRYRSSYDRGFRKGVKFDAACLGKVEIIEINLGSRQVTLKVISTGAERLMALEDARKQFFTK